MAAAGDVSSKASNAGVGFYKLNISFLRQI